MTAATNKLEAFNGFSQWIGFGNDPVEQEKTAKFNALLTNAVIFHNALDIAEIVRRLQEEGYVVAPEDLTHISPYPTEHIRRFGEYSTHELSVQPEAYDPHLDADFSPLLTGAVLLLPLPVCDLGLYCPDHEGFADAVAAYSLGDYRYVYEGGSDFDLHNDPNTPWDKGDAVQGRVGCALLDLWAKDGPDGGNWNKDIQLMTDHRSADFHAYFTEDRPKAGLPTTGTAKQILDNHTITH